MNLRKLLMTLFLSVMSSMLYAQFYVTGDNPGKLKWYSIDTYNFSIIYPQGADSLAKVYGHQLEKYRIPVSRTSGFLPGGPGKKRMPVVLHAYNTSNGSVAWAPKRMDLYTIPTAYSPEPMEWSEMLSIHESRHVSQMQFGLVKAHRPIGWFFGEMWNGLAAQLYLGVSNLEGDAVIAETALTNSGRGRTADFLNYYKVAFDNNDFRSWTQWRFMSQHRYSPDHYALGYLTLGGFRYLYDTPEFIGEAARAAADNPLRLNTIYKTTKKLTGKGFNTAFMEVCDTLHKLWKAEAEERAPFMIMEQVSKDPRLYTDYEKLTFVNNDLYAIKSGHLNSPVLVKINDDSSEKFISHFSRTTSDLKASDNTGRLYWTETYTDSRWSMKIKSRVKYSKLNDSKTNKRYLTGKDISNVFNPDVNPNNNMIATVSYDNEGNYGILVINGSNGKTVLSFPSPKGLQPVETAWIGQDIYVSMINDKGFGIWRYSDGTWTEVLGHEPVKLENFKSIGDELMFTCDRTGVNELYHFDPVSGELTQKTVTRYGGSDFTYSPDGKWLYFSSQTVNGKKIFRTPADSLINRKADFSQRHTWAIAEKLAQQEREIAASRGEEAVIDVETTFSEPRRYRKFPHAFNIHSWAPFYVSVDNIMNMSYDYTWSAISLGATGIIQNRLSTFTGEFGYSAHKDPYEAGRWRNSGHLKFTYSGWYPVIEVDVDFNDRSAMQTYMYSLMSNIYMTSHIGNTPYIKGKLSLYVPLNFSQGGWNSGFIPKVSYTASNDMFYDGMIKCANVIQEKVDEEGNPIYVSEVVEVGKEPGKNRFQQTVSASLRGYAMTGISNSAVYPRWGIGAEMGINLGLDEIAFFAPMGYIYAYGYIPGITRTHGIKLTYMVQEKLREKFSQPVVNIIPRGFNSDATVLRRISSAFRKSRKITLDYAAPIYTGDWSIGGTLFSVNRLVFTPHFDLTYIRKEGNLFSAGASLAIDLNSILWLEYPCSIGITGSYNGGSLFDKYTSGTTAGRYFVGPTFNVAF